MSATLLEITIRNECWFIRKQQYFYPLYAWCPNSSFLSVIHILPSPFKQLLFNHAELQKVTVVRKSQPLYLNACSPSTLLLCIVPTIDLRLYRETFVFERNRERVHNSYYTYFLPAWPPSFNRRLIFFSASPRSSLLPRFFICFLPFQEFLTLHLSAGIKTVILQRAQRPTYLFVV